MPSMRSLEIRCPFCRHQPLLAVAGRDGSGRPYIHVKSWKGGRLYTEIVITEGTAHLHCRDCYRWTNVRIRTDDLEHNVETLPSDLEKLLKADR